MEPSTLGTIFAVAFFVMIAAGLCGANKIAWLAGAMVSIALLATPYASRPYIPEMAAYFQKDNVALSLAQMVLFFAFACGCAGLVACVTQAIRWLRKRCTCSL